MKQICLLILLFVCSIVQAQLYFHDFGTVSISGHPYNMAPSVLQSNLTGSAWTNSTGAWTSYPGSSGEAIALANSGGSPAITHSFNISAGYKLNITSFDFWCQRSATGAQNWTMSVNGISVGSGTVPTTGASIGTTTVSNPVNGLSGTVNVVISLTGASGTGTFRLDDFTLQGTVIPNAFVLLDHFNRNDTIRPAIPSSGGPEWWREVEPGIFCSVLQTVRIKNNQLELSGCDLNNTACTFSPTQTTSMDASQRYPAVFSSAASTMEWYFNMQQSRADPTGFSSGQYGAAFVIGSNTNDPNPSLVKYGYAVIFGESGTSDSIRLVSFNGTAFNSSTFTNVIAVASPSVKTHYMSVGVSYNPCNDQWSLTVRDDGIAFADPATLSVGGVTAINSTFTGSNLPWMGSVWNHGNSCDLAKFDNIYIPNTMAVTGTYTWNGSVGKDFQSPYNWTPRRQCILSTDQLLFDNASPAICQVENIPSQTIGKITITNNRNITFSDVAGDGVVSTLTLSGALGNGLQVDAGSMLNLDGTTAAAGDAMVLSVATGATAGISGTLSFNSTPGGTKPHRLLAADALSLTVNSGGLIRAMDLSGNPFGNSLPQNTVVFNPGAAYECYSGANPFGLSQPDSKVLFQTGSVYRHFSNSQPSIPGRTYADFEFFGNTNITLGGAAPFTVDNLKIMSGSLEFTGNSNSLPIHTNINGDLVLLPGGRFNYDPVAASTITFNGATQAQQINSAGTLSLGRNLTVRLNSSFVTPPQLTVETDIALAGILDIVQGTLKLNGNITLLSNNNTTASVAPITGLISYGTGNFVVERYIPAHSKAWQFLSVPTTGQTVHAAWQEGNLPMVIGTPGFGTLISSNSAGAGFDLVGGNGPSMKWYDTTGAGSWKGIRRTDTALYNKKGYMIFVRGDRSVSNSASPATATILRSTGKLFDPVNQLPPVTSIGADKFESIGNPYASAIDFSNDLGVIKSANVQRAFYLWDPKLGGSFNYGGYQTFIKGSGTDYTVIPGGGSYPAGGSVQNFIQSGQAFFVHTFGGAGTVSFAENAKVAGSDLVTRGDHGSSARTKQLVTNLYEVPDSNRLLLDAVMNEFDPAYSDAIDRNDIMKLANVNESIGLVRAESVMAVERRSQPRTGDTIFYRMERLRTGAYELEFLPYNISQPGLSAFLIDDYLRVSHPVSFAGHQLVRFWVTNDPRSSSPGRFRLVFMNKAIVGHENDAMAWSYDHP